VLPVFSAVCHDPTILFAERIDRPFAAISDRCSQYEQAELFSVESHLYCGKL
jgi:hypothetical protein